MDFNQSFSVEFTVGLLLAVFSAKICEFYNRRDGYILLNLSLFILATAFLLRQDIGVVLIGLPVFFATLIGFIALNDKDEQTPTKRLNTLDLLVLPALPLLVVLFVFFLESRLYGPCQYRVIKPRRAYQKPCPQAIFQI